MEAGRRMVGRFLSIVLSHAARYGITHPWLLSRHSDASTGPPAFEPPAGGERHSQVVDPPEGDTN